MIRSELLSSRDYWINEIQNDLYEVIEQYMVKNNLTRTELAQELGVTKGYITQVLKGDFDHKISKLVDLAISSGKAPLLHFVDIDAVIKNDLYDKTYELIPVSRPRLINFDKIQEPIVKEQPKSKPTMNFVSITITKSQEILSFQQSNKNNLTGIQGHKAA